jgi:hypothetical protein
VAWLCRSSELALDARDGAADEKEAIPTSYFHQQNRRSRIRVGTQDITNQNDVPLQARAHSGLVHICRDQNDNLYNPFNSMIAIM